MEFERVPLPGWHWSVWSERQTAASSSPRWHRRQSDGAVHGWSTGQPEASNGCGELDAATAAEQWGRKQRRRYERAKQQPTGPGPPTATSCTPAATVPGTDATVHVSWQRRRRWKFSYTATFERGYQSWQYWQRWWRQWWWRWRWHAQQQQQHGIQQYAAKLRSSSDESSPISWIKLFANAVGW